MYTVLKIGTYRLMSLLVTIRCDVKKDKKKEIISP